MILPYVEQTSLYQTLNPDGCRMPPSATLFGGAPLLQTRLSVFTCSSNAGAPRINPYSGDATSGLYATANYVVNENVFYDGASARFAQIIDGLSNTFLIGEHALIVGPNPKASGGAIIFGSGSGNTGGCGCTRLFHAAWPINTWMPGMTATTYGVDAGLRRFAITSLHPGGAQFAFCDGTVKFVSQNIARNPNIGSDTIASNGGDNPPDSGFYGPLGDRGAGPGFVYQNLYSRSDGFPIGDY